MNATFFRSVAILACRSKCVSVDPGTDAACDGRYAQEEERDHEPRHQKYAESTGELGWVGVGCENTAAGDEDRGVGHPECTV